VFFVSGFTFLIIFLLFRNDAVPNIQYRLQLDSDPAYIPIQTINNNPISYGSGLGLPINYPWRPCDYISVFASDSLKNSQNVSGKINEQRCVSYLPLAKLNVGGDDPRLILSSRFMPYNFIELRVLGHDLPMIIRHEDARYTIAMNAISQIALHADDLMPANSIRSFMKEAAVQSSEDGLVVELAMPGTQPRIAAQLSSQPEGANIVQGNNWYGSTTLVGQFREADLMKSRFAMNGFKDCEYADAVKERRGAVLHVTCVLTPILDEE